MYDRLYEISKERSNKNNIRKMLDGRNPDESQISLSDSPDQKEATFAPQINARSTQIVRDRPVQDLLYDDAMRRNEAHKQRQEVPKVVEEVKKETKNIEYLVHKFNREFEPIFENVHGVAVEGEGDEEEDPSLNYRQLGELMYEMGYFSGSKVTE